MQKAQINGNFLLLTIKRFSLYQAKRPSSTSLS